MSVEVTLAQNKRRKMTISHVTYACTVHGASQEKMNVITVAVETGEVPPWSRVIFQNLRDLQLVQKISEFHRI